MGRIAKFLNWLLAREIQPTEPAKSEFGSGVGRAAEQKKIADKREFDMAVERERARRAGG